MFTQGQPKTHVNIFVPKEWHVPGGGGPKKAFRLIMNSIILPAEMNANPLQGQKEKNQAMRFIA